MSLLNLIIMAKQNRRASQLAYLSFLRTTGKYKVRSQKIYKIILRLDDRSLRPLTQHAKRFSEAAKAGRLIRTAFKNILEKIGDPTASNRLTHVAAKNCQIEQ